MTNGLRKLLFFVLLIGVTYLAYRFMIKPANKYLDTQKSQIQAKMVKLAELEKATTAAKDLSKQLNQLEEALVFFESKLPPTSMIHKVLEQVTIIAQNEGSTTKTIRTLDKKNNNGYIEQPLKMQLEGNFNSFYAFMLELEKLPRIMKIRDLRLSKSKSEGEISADFVVSIFFRG